MINRNNIKGILSIMIGLLFIMSTISTAGGLNTIHNPVQEPQIPTDQFESHDNANGIDNNFGTVDSDAQYNESTDLGAFLGDNAQEYTKKWDPWLTKAGINAIATTDDGDMMALASGYLYDNQIHLYRWNQKTDQYDLVWEVGGGVFKSDVTSLAFADTDYNNLTEIIAGSQDGRLYVFEQRHLYDPFTNMENQFDLVWTSPRLGRIFSVIVDDTDMDFRKDIIVGTSDTVRWFEYDTHGSYPFGEDHWINYREVFSYQMPSQVTALAITDLEYNGLKEVAVGMRSGEIQLLENNGTSLLINGYPYPIAQDNSYRSIWSNGNLIQRDISDMSGGDLDGDGQVELVVAVQGAGAYVLDSVNGEIAHYRLQRPFTSWEANPTEIYPLDNYADAMLNSSSISNGALVANPNVWFNNDTAGKYGEPLNYSAAHYVVYPYSSASVMKPDGRVTQFDATSMYAWATYDMGNDEEGAGNGVPSVWDLSLQTTSKSSNAALEVSISVDGTNWHKINQTNVNYNSVSKAYEVEVDLALANMSSLYYRYVKLNLTAGKIALDYIYTPYINNPIYDALSTEAGPLIFAGDTSPTTVGFIATIDGSILAAGWNTTTQSYEIMWDSWEAERYKLHTNIFDLHMVTQKTRFPAWMDYGEQSFTLDLNSATLPDGGSMMSYTAENFFNYRNEKDTEFIVSSSKGNMFVYKQDSPYSLPYYDADLTNMLFGISDSITLNSFMASKRAQGVDYFTASLVPVESRFASEFNAKGIQSGVNTYIDPVLNGYWLFVGSWDGYVSAYDAGSISVTPYINDVSVWYLTQAPTDYSGLPGACSGVSSPECGYFSPLLNSTTGLQSLTNMEVTGMMDGVFRQSSWMPKIASADFIGSKYADLVMTNGKVHLLETVLSQDEEKTQPENWINPADTFRKYLGLDAETGVSVKTLETKTLYVDIANAIDKEFSQVSYVYKGDYFKEINDNSKGRKWTNANPVDFDNDGDFDLVLGFVRYQESIFGIKKSKFGLTYWENQGTPEEPKWVEQSKAMNNNQIGSNFQHEFWADPVLSYNNYEFPDGLNFDPKLGYHPLYKVDLPDVLYMFQANSADDMYQGRLRGFYADYSPRTSLLAATYPEAKRIDINLYNNKLTGVQKKVNYGYHIFETWNNNQELNGWTMSMDTADLDGDGKNEVIVGDFNNNAYVFEHLTNNSFKRAYKTFDLNRTILTDQSPYANNQFGGISGTFYRTVFEHANLLQAGFDLNDNGQNEFIVSTGTMLFVFESTRTSVNRIRDDTYQLIKIFDLYDLPALSQMSQDDIQVTSMTWAPDLTRDGRNELIVGVNSALLVFEISKSPYTYEYSMKTVDPFNSPFFVGQEIFFGSTYDIRGKFDVPGNFILNPDYIINAIVVDDFDRDGKLDLIYAGTDTSNARPLWAGFITGLEFDGSTFVLGFDSDAFAKTVEYNPINDLAVMDADYDDKLELVIGHSYGVDIYEFPSEDTVELRDVITSNPHYMLPERSYFAPPLSEGVKITSRFKDVIRLDDRPWREGGSFTNNTIFMAYADWSLGGVLTTNKYNQISFASSYDDGKTWRTFPQLDINTDGGIYYYGIDKITMTETSDGSIWLGATMRYHNAGYGYAYSGYQIWRLAPSSQSWVSVWQQSSISSYRFGLNEPDPNVMSLVSIPSYTDRVVGVFTMGNASKVYTNNIFTTGSISSYQLASWAMGNTTNLGNFSVYDLDVEYIGKSEDGTDLFGMAFDGYINSERLSLDTDLFYAVGYYNTTLDRLVFDQQPQRTFSSGNGAYYPSLIQERDTGNILITFEQPTLRAYGGLYSVWSNDGGRTWHGPYDMSHPLGIDLPTFVAYPSPSGETYRVGTVTGDIFLQGFQPQSPVLVPGTNRGFTMTYTVKLQIRTPLKYSLCNLGQQHFAATTKDIKNSLQSCSLELNMFANAINPWSNWSWYDVGKVTDLAVGDSDGDYRQEIFVASGKNAHLFEFSHNSESMILYDQKWTSPDYERDITSVAISDANSNGAPELFIESDRGIVHSYEVVDVNPATTNLLKPANAMSKLITTKEYLSSIDLYDINNDGYKDIITTSSVGGYVNATDGKTFSPIWNFDIGGGSTEFTDIFFSQAKIVRDNTSVYYQVFFNDTLYNIDLLTGAQISSYSSSGIITHSVVGDVVGDSSLETVFVDATGHVTVLKASDFSSPTVFGISNETTIMWDVDIGNFVNPNITSIAVLMGNGNITVIDPTDGTIQWQTMANVSYYNNFLNFKSFTKGDFDGDGMTDIFVQGRPYAFAYSPSRSMQLWNQTLSFEGNNDDSFLDFIDNEQTDINGDNVTDIIFTVTGNSGNPPAYGAYDGRTGNLIYKYRPNVDARFLSIGVRSTILNLDGTETHVFSITVDSSVSSAYSLIVDAATGVPIAGIETSEALYSVVANDGPNNVPTMYIANIDGTIHKYEFYEGSLPPTPPTDVNNKINPFIRLGDEFTRRTNYLLHDAFYKENPGTDGYDDIFVIDDYFVGGADTYLLENEADYNKAVWTYNDLDVGRYYGGAFIADLGSDGKFELVAPFQNLLIVFDVQTGDVIDKWDYTPSDFMQWKHLTMQVIDWNGDGRLDIVYSREVYEGGIPMMEYGWFKDGVVQYGATASSRAKGFNRGQFIVTDLDGDNQNELVTYSHLIYNDFVGNFTMFTGSSMSKLYAPSFINPMDGLMPFFPVTHLVAADNGGSLYFSLDYSTYNIPGLPFDLSKFPTLLLGFTYSTGSFNYKSTNAIGISELPGFTRQLYNVVDQSGEQYLLGVGRRGDLYSMHLGSGILLENKGVFDSIAVPYTRNIIEFGNFCGANSFYMVTSATSIGCYDTYDFSSPITAQSSIDLNFDIIQDMVKGNLDGGDGIDDIIVASRSGYVWIVSSKENAAALDLLVQVETPSVPSSTGISQQVENVPQWVYIMLASSLSIGTMVYRKKF